jgi:hypothetical protein
VGGGFTRRVGIIARPFTTAASSSAAASTRATKLNRSGGPRASHAGKPVTQLT